MNEASEAKTAIGLLSPEARRLLAVEILLADPETLHDDVLETCLYMLRDRLKGIKDLDE